MFDHSSQPRVPVPGAGGAVSGRPSRGRLGVTIVLVSAMFALYGAWRAPVPGVNEPHYLCKARHFWDTEWCRGDLFLESSNPHAVFYATVGALTRVLTFEQTAWVGRGLVWIALAIGWIALAQQVMPGRWGAVWGAALFAALSATGNLSGEWLIGGVEAKGFSYAALFLGLAAACSERWFSAAAWCGVAVSFHPVAGIWGVLALSFARAWSWLGNSPTASEGVDPPRPSIVREFAPVVVCGLLSLPGLIPAFALLIDRAPPEVSRTADELQVFHRLDHHLDPRQFKASGWVMYAMLLAVWLAARPWKANDTASRLFFRFVVGTLLIAFAGMAVGFGPRWASVLKFYPFRLADLFLPIAVALTMARWMEALTMWLGRRSVAEGAARDCPETFAPPTPALLPRGGEGGIRATGGAVVAGHVVAVSAVAWALVAPGNDRNPTGWTTRQNADWLEVCRWVAEQTPADALCLTPRFRNYTFKWYAERAEYAIWKDCPQDAASLVEWQRRLDVVRRWRGAHYKSGYTERAIEELRELTDIDYIVDWYVQPYRVEPLYRNESFRVYRTGRMDSGK